MSESVETTEASSAGMDRRSVLKAAVAAGVGVAVWSSPSITSIGGTPAYAYMCTGGKTSHFLGQRNTSCDCYGPYPGGTGKYVQYKWPATSDCGTPTGILPVSVSFNFGNNGECAPTTYKQSAEGDAAVTLGSNGSGLSCKIHIDVVSSSCGTTVLGSADTAIIGPGGGTAPMPAIACASGAGWPSNIFLKVYLECAADEACIY